MPLPAQTPEEARTMGALLQAVGDGDTYDLIDILWPDPQPVLGRTPVSQENPPVTNPWANPRTKLSKYLKDTNKYMIKHFGKDVFLSQVRAFDPNFVTISSSFLKDVCMHTIRQCFTSLRTHWVSGLRVKYRVGVQMQQSTSDVGARSLERIYKSTSLDIHRFSLTNPPYVELRANTTCYGDRGDLHENGEITCKRSKFKPEDGTQNNPWTLNIYDIDKGLGLALKDFPVLEKKMLEGNLTPLNGELIVQYALFGKQIFSII